MSLMQVRAEGRLDGTGVQELPPAQAEHNSPPARPENVLTPSDSDEDAIGETDDEHAARQASRKGKSASKSVVLREKRLRRVWKTKRADAESDEWHGNESDISHDEYSDFDDAYPIRVADKQYAGLSGEVDEESRGHEYRDPYVRIYDVNVTLPKSNVSDQILLSGTATEN